MKKILILTLSLITTHSFSQVIENNHITWVAKEFSKELSLFKSKEFLLKHVLGSTNQVVPFEVIPLASSHSGELTTLLYKCDAKQKEGLILGFYGDFWTETGVLCQGYAFKNLEKEKAVDFLNKITTSIEENKNFLNANTNNNNIFFKYDDMDILIWIEAGAYSIRIFWQGFDSTWEKTAFQRSKKRFEKKIKQ